ncbi:hypothetical protein D0U04_20415 [Bacillus clarus]|uniref:Lipoprotein n=1 Tax=Bacillus clarus TaxID=2338372 RepID=A0A090Z4H8_9BACI|nr:hypothetical protein [Bacillus clarus]KFM99310.1 hypothetical protein DJ93_5162 [Bacillus clarus]RFT64956.1 hypothetical protein D0U04_20415 [Bacillus clarus]
MKSLIKITCTAFILTGIMAGCSEGTTAKQEVSTQEKNALLYGEIAKSENYRATVENAKYEKIDKTSRITARVTINNARIDEKAIDLSELTYSMKDEKTEKKYRGQVIPMYEDKFKNVPVGFSLTFEVSFNMDNPPKDLNNMYLYMDSKNDPFTNTYLDSFM